MAAFGGVWKRTGETFNVWTGPTGGALATCRFFSTSFAPKSSHFYTPFASECATAQASRDWQFESIAFYLQLPNTAGVCPAGTVVLYRLYNNGMGGAPNHRYTTSLATFNQMRAAGWIFEGNGLTGAFACVPPVSTAEGLYYGTTSRGKSIYGIVLDNGTFYVIYTAPGSSTVAGVVNGVASSANGLFTSPNARDFAIGTGVYAASVSGSFLPRASLNGVIAESGLSETFAASYVSAYEQPASLALVAGSYAGSAASSAGWQPLSSRVAPNAARTDGFLFIGGK